MKKEKRDPSSHRTPSQIKKMNKTYDSKPKQIKHREMSNKARADLMREGVVKKGDGKDVDHIKPVRSGGTNKRSNLRAIDKSRNRGWRDGV
jgi:hypothetical protein